jgi:DNA-binding NtrC family response regulator
MPEYRVLIVEDEARLRELLCDVLPGMGFEAVAARTAHEAWRVLEAEGDGADIVMLDLNLPVVDGMSFLEAFRRKFARTPVIIMTGFGNLEAARRAIHLGVVEFLTKPCHLGEIEQALDRARRMLVEGMAGGRGAEAASSSSTAEKSPGTTPLPGAGAIPGAGVTLAEMEREAILGALVRHGGNRSAAAAELGISRRTLYNKLAEYQRQGFDVGSE